MSDLLAINERSCTNDTIASVICMDMWREREREHADQMSMDHIFHLTLNAISFITEDFHESYPQITVKMTYHGIDSNYFHIWQNNIRLKQYGFRILRDIITLLLNT
jgi:hypothetical protein